MVLMDGLASTAIYLASSLTIAPHTTYPVRNVVVTLSAPILRAETASATVDLVNPFAVARAHGGKSLDEAIAQEVARDAVDRPASDDDAGFAPYPERDDDQSLSKDVAAAHEARIAVIRRKMDELRLEGASKTASLVRLGVKLRLATAAKRLAVAREAIDHLPAYCGPLDSDACDAAPVAVAMPRHQASRRGRPRPLPIGYHHEPAGMSMATLRPPPDRVAGTYRATVPDRLHAGAAARRAVGGSLPHPAAQALARRGSGRAAGDASAHVRRLLATARHLLEDGTVHPPHVGVELAGLLHWDGSETWSLADYPRSTA